MILNVLILLLALTLLIVGAEMLVRGASRLATRFNVSAFVIGVTVVGFGTSAPELAASLTAATTGHAGMAVGNVVGSNIMNIALVLGVTALIAPIPVRNRVIWRETIFTIVVSFLPLLALANGGVLSRELGILFVVGLIGFLWWSFASNRSAEAPSIASKTDKPTAPTAGRRKRLVAEMALLIFGFVLLVAAANRLVVSATEVARELGVSEVVIGLTIVAGGTSAPELATSLVAVLRGKTDLGVGNILGSCIFNILGILGITAIVIPIEIPIEVFQFDLPVMICVSIACFPILLSGHRINRFEGGLLTSTF
ncbi:MAG: calcium/sodium antiporter, partial [Phycisphaerales bacterium]|nr:calcium/sodium antiporter [Phycisphaerales bacterium]